MWLWKRFLMKELLESIEDVVRLSLPVDERFVITKHRFMADRKKRQKRICIVLFVKLIEAPTIRLNEAV